MIDEKRHAKPHGVKPLPPAVGPYRIVRRLGGGGMGEVFEGYDAARDLKVAIKLIRSEVAHDDKARLRFRREARASSRLDHPATVKVYQVLELEAGDAIVMELVEGTDLAQRMREGPMKVSFVVALARQIAAGLGEAHAKGIVHRDLKAENVMVNSAGRTKILDFGLAKYDSLQDEEGSLTTQGKVRGTSRSMSPEQVRGLPVDARSDLFSFGVLLYEMLSGESPFLADGTARTLRNVCTLEPVPVRELRPDVPRELSELVERLLEKDPPRRPQSAREVERSLEDVPVTQEIPADFLRDATADEDGDTATIEAVSPFAGFPKAEETSWYESFTGRPALLAAVVLLLVFLLAYVS